MKKIEDYWYFDIKRFVREHPEHVAELNDLQEALAEIAETKTPNFGSPPGTPGRGDSVPATAEQSDAIRHKIQQIRPLVELYQRAQNGLTDEEKTIIDYLFHRPGLHTSNAAYLARSLHMDVSTVYRRSNSALRKMAGVIGVRIK